MRFEAARLPRRLRLLGVTERAVFCCPQPDSSLRYTPFRMTDHLSTPHHGTRTELATPHMERDQSRDKSPSRGRGLGWGQNYITAQAVASVVDICFPSRGRGMGWGKNYKTAQAVALWSTLVMQSNDRDVRISFLQRQMRFETARLPRRLRLLGVTFWCPVILSKAKNDNSRSAMLK